MFYRPNFCCNCGEKIERVEWSLFTSGKFCDLCQNEFRVKDWGTRLLAAAGIVFLTALISSFFRPAQLGSKAVSSEPVPLSTTVKPRADANFNTTQITSSQSQTGTNVNTSTVSPPPANPAVPEQAVKTNDVLYYCGAATKKGTPCSRRVKRPGERCWQHQGMPSILDENRTPRK
jgi:hypothetical protein